MTAKYFKRRERDFIFYYKKKLVIKFMDLKFHNAFNHFVKLLCYWIGFFACGKFFIVNVQI